MTNLKKILRWLLFLPISILCGGLVFLAFDNFVGRYIGPGTLGSYINHIAAGGLSGAAAVYIGVYIAPSYEKKVAIGYAVITLIVLILSLTLPIFYPESFVSQTNREYFSFVDNLTEVARNIGMFYMAWNIYRGKVVFEKTRKLGL